MLRAWMAATATMVTPSGEGAASHPSSFPARSALQQLQLPRIGLGMAALGRPGYINLGHGSDITDRSVEAMRQQAHATLDAAYITPRSLELPPLQLPCTPLRTLHTLPRYEAGIRYIDCARSYGLSEDFVASWLAARPEAAPAVTVGSKWGYEYTAAWRVQVGEGESHEVKQLTVEVLTRQLEETKAYLPGVALYQIHSASLDVLEDEAVLAALGRLRDSGTVVGLSVSHPQPPTIEAAIAVQVGGRPLFGAVQATFNLLDPSCGAALQKAYEAGMFVIIKEAVANGRLVQGAPRPLREEAEARGVGVDALSLAWVLSHPWVGLCLSGASTPEQAQQYSSGSSRSRSRSRSRASSSQ